MPTNSRQSLCIVLRGSQQVASNIGNFANQQSYKVGWYVMILKLNQLFGDVFFKCTPNLPIADVAYHMPEITKK